MLVGEPGADLAVEPPGEEHDRGDACLLDRGYELIGFLDGQRDRLREQQVLACLSGSDGERYLHLRWDGERDRACGLRRVPRQRGRGRAVPGRERLRGGLVTSPH